jgi:hypothetical protein
VRGLRIFLVAQKEERGRAEDSNDVDYGVVTDEVRVNHERDTEEHRLPQAHSLSVDESDETDRAKNKTTDQISRAQIEHDW